MRIRKNVKLSSIYPPELLQPQICQLNQSPWDILQFTEEDNDASLFQLDGGNDIAGNRSLFSSTDHVERATSLLDQRRKSPTAVLNDSHEQLTDKGKNVMVVEEELEQLPANIRKLEERDGATRCKKNDGKRWQCKNDAISGYSLCHHHSYNRSATKNLLIEKSLVKGKTLGEPAGSSEGKDEETRKPDSVLQLENIEVIWIRGDDDDDENDLKDKGNNGDRSNEKDDHKINKKQRRAYGKSYRKRSRKSANPRSLTSMLGK